MSRHTFLADVASWVIDTGAATTSGSGLAGDTAVMIPAQPVTFWDSQSGGTQYTDLLDDTGAAVTSATSGTDGSLPQISGPDGVSVMWADAAGGAGPRRLVTATDLGPEVDSLSAAVAGLPATRFTDRGVVAASTTYNPGDLVVCQGQRVYVTTAFTTGAGNPPVVSSANYVPVTSQAALYYATDFGVAADAMTDNGPKINAALQAITAAGGGRFVFPAASPSAGKMIMTGQTIIIPPNVRLAGQGSEVTQIRLLPGSNCDVVQFEQYNSASQAAILGVSASTLKNAFYAGAQDICFHGNASAQTAGTYSNVVTAVTNPLTTAAGSDPDFDPYNWLINVETRSGTGDGLFCNGRSALRVIGCISRYNNGNGVTPSFDTLFSGCDVGFNGISGIYNNHSSTSGSAVKCYNNGQNAQWVSGTSYSAGQPVMYSGAMYVAKNAISSDTTAPSADTTNWAAVTATSPAAWGCDFYFDGGAYEQTWTAVDSQEPSAYSYYFNNSGSITVTGASNRPNFNQDTSALNTTNPNNYAAAYLSSTSGGINLVLTVGQQGGESYALSVQNGSTENNIIITTDGSEQGKLAPGSVLAGSFAVANGAFLSSAVSLPSSAASVASSGTISTSGPGATRVTTSAAVTGVILAAGTASGQRATVINESANSITFAASGTSHVADGTSDVIAANTARTFIWDGSLWYRVS
jgi:hypothetical protein